MWGCGGLGSWVAELVVRASPEKVVLRDPGQVHHGHLVRQNYTEHDVGGLKAEQLAERLRAISDETEVVVGSLSALDAIESGELPKCDLVIDATIGEAVAFHLDKVAAQLTQGPLLIQVATDIASASLGLIVVAPASFPGGPATVEDRVADAVLDRGDLEPYHTFWNPSSSTAELTPRTWMLSSDIPRSRRRPCGDGGLDGQPDWGTVEFTGRRNPPLRCSSLRRSPPTGVSAR